ncbi:MAG TPA: RHS repeat-associated core domain-containing protein, partial [Candidatus Acidoferrum sp.]|nr:RHS repeat-associated core domain-containing protein [Candidatus Acidoferrum sp.]
AVAQNYTYDSFGNIVATSGSIVNNFRYTGREWDTETSLYYYRARYYDPQDGRFLSEDPIGFRGGIDRYAYVHNRVTNRLDSFGLQECGPCMDPNGLQRLVIKILQPVSKATGWTIGIGVGGSIGGGPGIRGPGGLPSEPASGYAGGSAGASRQLVVSPNGQAAIATSLTAGVAGGFGGYAGPQVSISNAQTPDDLGGPFGAGGVGVGDILGGGLDVALGKGTKGQRVWQGTLTGGIGLGGKGYAGGGSNTTVEPICD